ncbi:MAG TPA: hypothetical protein VKD70_04000 [Candidatus Acidoferrum sp.]|nr:hypothetical protein [Candidatus Acidoferrum sp.]
MGALDSPLYFVIKLLAYCTWCFIGLRWFQPAARLLLAKAVGFGVLRLFMGFFFGILIYFISSALVTQIAAGLPRNTITYFAVYVPVRWIEWGIMSAILNHDSRTNSPWFFGWSVRDRYWRLGGIVISCLADIPLIYSLGGVIPTGRFMC